MSELLELQWKFMRALPLLILKAHELGYECSCGDALRDERVFGKVGERKGYGHPSSAHKVKLAFDLNLFKDGKYITDWTGHKELHDYWDTLGGAERITGDPNHYSFFYRGFR